MEVVNSMARDTCDHRYHGHLDLTSCKQFYWLRGSGRCCPLCLGSCISKSSHRWLSPGMWGRQAGRNVPATLQFFKCIVMTLIFLDYIGRLSPGLVPEPPPFSCAESSVFCELSVHSFGPCFRWNAVCFRILFKCFVLNEVSSRLCALSFSFTKLQNYKNWPLVSLIDHNLTLMACAF